MTRHTFSLHLRLVVLLVAASLLTAASPGQRAAQDELRAWKQVEAQVDSNNPQRLLDRAEDYLTAFPEGQKKLEASYLAGRAALELERWTACHHHFQSYLSSGGRKKVEVTSLRAMTCLARDGRLTEAIPALRNIANNDDDPQRAAAAIREIVRAHLTTCLLYTSPSPRDRG